MCCSLRVLLLQLKVKVLAPSLRGSLQEVIGQEASSCGHEHSGAHAKISTKKCKNASELKKSSVYSLWYKSFIK